MTEFKNIVELLISTDLNDRYKKHFNFGKNGFSISVDNIPDVSFEDHEVDEINWEYLAITQTDNCDVNLNHKGFIDIKPLMVMQPFSAHEHMKLTTMSYEDTKYVEGKIVCRLVVDFIQDDDEELRWNVKPVLYEVHADNFGQDFRYITSVNDLTNVFRIGYDTMMSSFFFFIDNSDISRIYGKNHAANKVNYYFADILTSLAKAKYGGGK